MVDPLSNGADDNDSLNRIVLSAEMVTRLYARSLVQPEPAADDEAAASGTAPAGQPTPEISVSPDQKQSNPVESGPPDICKSVTIDAESQIAAQESRVKSEDDAVVHAERDAARPVKFLGSNEKKVLLLVINPDVAFLSEEQLTLVTKMLKACELNLGDVAIVNLAGGPELSELLPALQPQKLISFGALDPAPTPPFPVISKDGMEWLMAPALGSLLQETGRSAPLKTGLWQAMQQLFNLTVHRFSE